MYEPIEIGDTIRTYINTTNFSKGAEPRFSEVTYKISGIEKNANGDEEYRLNGKSKAYCRHELRLVKPAQDHKTMD